MNKNIRIKVKMNYEMTKGKKNGFEKAGGGEIIRGKKRNKTMKGK